MASLPPGSPNLSLAPSLKRSRRTPEILPTVNYMYQMGCPEGCISKSAAMRDYKLKESDFKILQPAKVVPNPHCPTKNAYWFRRTELESYIRQCNTTAGVTKVTAVAMGGSRPRKKSSEAGTPSPVKTLRKKIQGFAFNTEDRGITLSTRDTLNSKEDKSPVRKKHRVTIASIEILDDGGVLDLPIEKD